MTELNWKSRYSQLRVSVNEDEWESHPKFKEIITMLKERPRTKSLEPKIRSLSKFTKKATAMKRLKKNAFERYIVSQSCSGVFDKTKSTIEDKNIRNLTMSMTKGKEDDVTGFKILFKRVKKNFDKEYYKKELKTLTYRLFGKEEMLKKSQKKNMFT